MSASFHFKRALVTGAGKGIGRGIALKLAYLGAKVHAISRTQADLESLRKECSDIDVCNVDIADWDKTRLEVESIGPIDLLVNNAGVLQLSPFVDATKDHLDNVFDINFKAAFNISQVVVKGMIERGQGGSIVNISSIGGLKPYVPATSVYGSSKAALNMLTRNMASELGPHNIRVNSVNPGVLLTSMVLKHNDAETIKPWFIPRIPLGRLTEVDDVVNTTLFLLSDQAAMVNGVTLSVDGGEANC